MKSTEEEVTAEERTVETPTSEEDAKASAMRKRNRSPKRASAGKPESSPKRTLRALKMYATAHSNGTALTPATHLSFQAQGEKRNHQEYRYGADAPHR